MSKLNRVSSYRPTFKATLDGLELQRPRIDDQISAIRSMLNGPSARTNRKRKYRFSPEGRARIAKASRKRWAAIKKAARAKKGCVNALQKWTVR